MRERHRWFNCLQSRCRTLGYHGQDGTRHWTGRGSPSYRLHLSRLLLSYFFSKNEKQRQIQNDSQFTNFQRTVSCQTSPLSNDISQVFSALDSPKRQNDQPRSGGRLSPHAHSQEQSTVLSSYFKSNITTGECCHLEFYGPVAIHCGYSPYIQEDQTNLPIQLPLHLHQYLE